MSLTCTSICSCVQIIIYMNACSYDCSALFTAHTSSAVHLKWKLLPPAESALTCALSSQNGLVLGTGDGMSSTGCRGGLCLAELLASHPGLRPSGPSRVVQGSEPLWPYLSEDYPPQSWTSPSLVLHAVLCAT